MHLEPIIGLEIHLQLKTQSKMFCSCPTHDKALAPNVHICPICVGHPGTLPVANKQAVEWTVLFGLALNCEISSWSKFDRKNYFYPDLPKGYQVSQFDLPIAHDGYVDITFKQGPREHLRIGITRAHLEEDAAKSFHQNGKTYVDFNRSSTPLIETVTEPDFRSPAEAKTFLQELRLIARYLDISDADMEKGHMRCDANISLREVDEHGVPIRDGLSPKTEIKNLNSFRSVERALTYEIERQTHLWNAGTPPHQETTRGWNDEKQQTEEQRIKESAGDYRYFPDPDLPPLELTILKDELQGSLPELPAEKRKRFIEEYFLPENDGELICEDIHLANYTEHVFSELYQWMKIKTETEKKALAKLMSSWLLSKLGGLLHERNMTIKDLKITPENFAEFVSLLSSKRLPAQNGLLVLTEMLETGADPSQILEEKNLGFVEDEGLIANAVDHVLEQQKEEVLRYKNGEKQLLTFFMGQVMKETKGKADPGVVSNMLKVKLEG